METETQTAPQAETPVLVPAPVPQEAKYTDQQLNDLIAKNSAKAAEKAERSFFEKLGIKDASELDSFKTARESQMSEVEKSAAREKEKDARIELLQKESDAKDAVNEALMKGVPSDKVERVKKLVLSGVYEGDSIADKVAAVLAEFPEYAKSQTVSIGAKTSNQTIDAQTELLARARKQAGLTN